MRNKIFTILLGLIAVLIGTTRLSAQGVDIAPCGEVDHEFEFKPLDLVQARVRVLDTEYEIPLKFWVVESSSGTKAASLEEINTAMESLNSYFEESPFTFTLDPNVERITDSELFNYNHQTDFSKTVEYRQSDRVNIIVANTLSSSGKAVCGFAFFPISGDVSDADKDKYNSVFMARSCLVNSSTPGSPTKNTLAHELGHYFGLFHTHETSKGKELVNGSNCSEAGDFVCDTPADPKLGYANTSNGQCIYNGEDLDELGQAYNPDVNNIMSYSPYWCRKSFTPNQLERMEAVFTQYRAEQVSHVVKRILGSGNLGTEARVSPNPVVGNRLRIVKPGGLPRSLAQVIDASGHEVCTFEAEGNSHEEDISYLAPGIYVLRLKRLGGFSEEGEILRFVKK
ncbi:zinc-dependent metalloprotease [Fulvitalea axinellae]